MLTGRALGKLDGRAVVNGLLSTGRLAAPSAGKCLVELEPPAGIEPATSRLQGAFGESRSVR